MAIYLVKLPDGSGVNRSSVSRAMIVEADDVTKAKAMADARYGADSKWATVTTLTTGAAPDLEGFTYRVRVSGGPGAKDLFDVSYTGAGSEDIDVVGNNLVSKLQGEDVAAAIQDDGGAYTDDTTAANNATADDVELLPAVPASGDNILIGGNYKFNRALFNITTAGAGTYTIAWEYWNGTAWAALTGAVDDTGSFKNSGFNDVTFTPPANWAASTINSQGPFYYIRGKVDGGTTTTVPLAGQIMIGKGLRASYDSGTDVLTVAAVADGLGDKTLSVTCIPNGCTQPLASMIGTIVDKGVAAAVLSVDLTGHVINPAIIEEI